MSGSALLLKLLSIFQEEFLCPRSERCIPRTWLCDGDLDCAPDARPPSEDEAPDLCSRKKCGRGEFQCLSGQCVPRHFYCDGDADCADKSDEASCNYVEHCPAGRHACPDHSGCLPLERLCDGVHDCRDRSDEDAAVCEARLSEGMVNLTSAAVRSPCEGRKQFREDIQL